MASARNEATKAPGAEGAEGVGVRRGCPLPTRGGLWGGGYAPSPEFFFYFGAQNVKFWCILGANFIAVELSVLHA